jgi:hypothetical protein
LGRKLFTQDFQDHEHRNLNYPRPKFTVCTIPAPWECAVSQDRWNLGDEAITEHNRGQPRSAEESQEEEEAKWLRKWLCEVWRSPSQQGELSLGTEITLGMHRGSKAETAGIPESHHS